MRRLFLMGLFACAGPRSTAPIAEPPAPEPTGPVRPIAALFGRWDEDMKFERTTRIEKTAGQLFGWRIKTRCTGPLKFREVIQMPAPGDWAFTPEDLPGTTVSDDQTSTTTIDYAACKQGWVEHVWSVAAGDPAGTYVITVELDGYARTTFRPKFVTPP